MRFGRSLKRPSMPQQPQMPQQPEMPQKAVPPGLAKLMEMRRDSPISIGRPVAPPGMPQVRPMGAGAGFSPEYNMKQMASLKSALQGKPMKKGGVVKSSASKRADGCASKGKTKGRFV